MVWLARAKGQAVTDRPNLLALSVCVALTIVSGLGLVLNLLGMRLSWELGGVLFLLFVFAATYPAARAMNNRERDQERYGVALTVAQELTNAERRAKLEQAAAVGQVIVIRQVPVKSNGQVRTLALEERWPAEKLAWYRCYGAGLDWVERLEGACTSPAMLEAGAFSRAEDWQAWANGMQANGWLWKETGKASRLLVEADDIRAALSAGKFTYDVKSAPPKVSPAFQGIPALPLSGEVVAEGVGGPAGQGD